MIPKNPQYTQETIEDILNTIHDLDARLSLLSLVNTDDLRLNSSYGLYLMLVDCKDSLQSIKTQLEQSSNQN